MAEDYILSEEAFAEASRLGEEEMRTKPFAASAHYDAASARVVIELTNGCTLWVPADLIQDVRDLTPEQRADIEVSPSGYGLHWPAADFDISVQGLASGVFGTRRYMEQIWAARAGAAKSPAKAAAARANGAKGGRPRKAA